MTKFQPPAENRQFYAHLPAFLPAPLPAQGRVFHYHLKKCGGTSMNAWLDTLSSAARAFNPDWDPGGTPARPSFGLGPRRLGDVARAVFHWSDIVHTHSPIWRSAPLGTFSFTVLRDPLQRLISQYNDWRSLTDEDLAGYDEEVRTCIASTRDLTLAEFLQRHGEGTASFFMHNYMTRALAESRNDRQSIDMADLDDLLGEALHVLHTDFDFIGIADDAGITMNALCARLGVPPAGHLPRLNARPALDDAQTRLDPDLLARFTGYDRILYDEARALFGQRHRALGERYDTEYFETHHAGQLMAGLRATCRGRAAAYSVKEPFYGSDLLHRDGGYTGNHAVWTRSGCRAALYIPVPIGMRLDVLLWIRGYADPAQREALRVWLDGMPQIPHFTPEEGYAELLHLPYLPRRPFVRLELEVPLLDPPLPEDPRPRGVAFDLYGWRPAH